MIVSRPNVLIRTALRFLMAVLDAFGTDEVVITERGSEVEHSYASLTAVFEYLDNNVWGEDIEGEHILYVRWTRTSGGVRETEWWTFYHDEEGDSMMEDGKLEPEEIEFLL